MAEDLTPAELVSRGTEAHLTGRTEAAVRDLQRASSMAHDAGHLTEAFRAAFVLAMVFGTSQQPAQFSGWTARAERLVEELDPAEQAVPRGYLDVLHIHLALQTGDAAVLAEAAPRVIAAGREHHEPDLLALGLTALGRYTVYAGDVPAGLALLDEAMTGILAGECGRLAAGLAWCAAIEGCQEIGAVDRLCEWTGALATWCSVGPEPGLITGRCSIHTGQVLGLRGDWTAALEAFEEARARLERIGDPPTAAWAEVQRGDLLRRQGRTAEAERAYLWAAEHGSDPQPGLALLWWDRGERDAALGAIRRRLKETPLPALRVLLLPEAVELFLAAGQGEDAARLAEELDGLAALTGCSSVAASAAHAHAGVELDRGDPAGALPYARKAVQGWGAVGAPFQLARSRLGLARALIGVGDAASARVELEAVQPALVRLGAAPAVAEAERIRREHGLEAGRATGPASGAVRATGGDGDAADEPSDANGAPDGLTAREVEVLRLLAGGRSNREIAGALVISEKTVARHLSNIFTKIDVGSRTAAAAYAFHHGLT